MPRDAGGGGFMIRSPPPSVRREYGCSFVRVNRMTPPDLTTNLCVPHDDADYCCGNFFPTKVKRGYVSHSRHTRLDIACGGGNGRTINEKIYKRNKNMFKIISEQTSNGKPGIINSSTLRSREIVHVRRVRLEKKN